MLPRLKIHAVTPADPASATLLKTADEARAKAASPSAAADASGKPVRALRYEPFVGLDDGRGTILLKTGRYYTAPNTGTITYHREAPSSGTTSGANPVVTELVVTAVPATGGPDAASVLRFPVEVDIAPGDQVEVPIRLPALPGVQPSFLVSARLLTADPDEQPTSAAVVFWMRGAAAVAMVCWRVSSSKP